MFLVKLYNKRDNSPSPTPTNCQPLWYHHQLNPPQKEAIIYQNNVTKKKPNQTIIITSIFLLLLIYSHTLCSQKIKGKICHQLEEAIIN